MSEGRRGAPPQTLLGGTAPTREPGKTGLESILPPMRDGADCPWCGGSGRESTGTGLARSFSALSGMLGWAREVAKAFLKAGPLYTRRPDGSTFAPVSVDLLDQLATHGPGHLHNAVVAMDAILAAADAVVATREADGKVGSEVAVEQLSDALARWRAAVGMVAGAESRGGGKCR